MIKTDEIPSEILLPSSSGDLALFWPLCLNSRLSRSSRQVGYSDLAPRGRVALVCSRPQIREEKVRGQVGRTVKGRGVMPGTMSHDRPKWPSRSRDTKRKSTLMT